MLTINSLYFLSTYVPKGPTKEGTVYVIQNENNSTKLMTVKLLISKSTMKRYEYSSLLAHNQIYEPTMRRRLFAVALYAVKG